MKDDEKAAEQADGEVTKAKEGINKLFDVMQNDLGT